MQGSRAGRARGDGAGGGEGGGQGGVSEHQRSLTVLKLYFVIGGHHHCTNMCQIQIVMHDANHQYEQCST